MISTQPHPASPFVKARNPLPRWRRLRWLGALFTAMLPTVAIAVVCPFTTYMPSGKYPVGHDAQWTQAAQPADRRLVQWWYPAEPLKDSYAANYVYSDYLREALQSHPTPVDELDPEQDARMGVFIKAKKDRGVSEQRFDHLMAATMLAARESTLIAGDWPVLWLDGDPSFADQLASHGFIVVSSPPLAGTIPTQEQRVQTARTAIEATRTKFKTALLRIGMIGFGERAPLAARLAGLYPQSAGLALVGDWTVLDARRARKAGQWLDPAEIFGATLHIVAGATTPAKLERHPLDAPFSATTRFHISDIDDVHVEQGLPASCVRNYVDGRAVPSLTLILAQREIRLRLAEFFGKLFDLPIEPAPLALLPIDERRRLPLNTAQAELSARMSPPPNSAKVAALLASGDVDALLNAVPKASLAELPTSWWNNTIAQMYVASAAAEIPQLLSAWQQHQPGSVMAAVHIASAASEKGEDARKLWKQAHRLLKSDSKLAPAQREELSALIDKALKKR